MRLLKLVPDDTNFDFLRWRKLAIVISTVLIIASVALIAVRGLNFGVDFAGGQLIRVTNITTHTLGVVLWDDSRAEEYVFPMIRKMTPVPVQTKNSFGTAKANMKNAIVRVVEGESTVPSECTPLGICDIELPPFLPKGSPIELTYSYNENQVLEVVVEAYGRQNRVSIARNTGLSEGEIAEATADLSLITVI